MHDLSPYAYASQGSLIVLGDGPELLAYSGHNDQGIWKWMAEDILMGVGATQDQVIAIDASGRISLFRAVDGHALSALDTDASPIAARVSPAGHVAMIEANGLVLVRPGVAPLRVPWSEPRHLSWSGDETRIGVGGADGQFFAVDPSSGGAWGGVSLGAPITGVAWRGTGSWAVAHGQQVTFVSADGTEVLGTLPLGGAAGEVSVSADGAILAAAVGSQRVLLFELHTHSPLGEVTFQRDLGHLQFGPKHWLGFGFEDGDANRLDVVTGTVTRTQAHVGRGQNAWAIHASVNQALVRGGIANVVSSGQSIASVGKPKADKPVGKRKLPWGWIIGGGVGAMIVLCCGSGGIVTLVYAVFGG